MNNKLIYNVDGGKYTKSGIFFNYSAMKESYNLHWHDFYELEVVVSGKCGECLNGEYFEVSEGDVYILTPPDIHSFILPDEGGHVGIASVRFYEAFVSEHIRECLKKITTAIIPKVEPEQYRMILSLADRAKEEMRSPNAFRNAAAEHMLSCILCMLLSMENVHKPQKSNDKSYISLVLDYISNNYTNDISLEDAADALSLSKCYLSTLMSDNIGKGFREILNVYRLRHVTTELLSTEKTITDICYGAGYQNFSHFSRVFRQHFGMTPAQYRKQVDGMICMHSS